MNEPRERGFAAFFSRARGTVRVKLTLAVTLLFAAALSIGATLLVRSVEYTVLRAVEAADREQLEQLRVQIEGGVPFDGLRLSPGPRQTIFQIRRPDGTVVQHSPEPLPPPFMEPPPPPFVDAPPPPPHGFGILAPHPPDPEFLPPPHRTKFADDYSVVEMDSMSPDAGE